jgi:hypothetical protein
MAKRQMDSTIIQQNWYMELDSRARNLWWHLFLSCDNIGVFELNTRLIGVFTGEKFSRKEIFSLFGGRVVPVPNHPDKGIIVDFVSCQSKGGVQGNAPWQRAMRSRMNELGITEDYLFKMSSRKERTVESQEEEEEELTLEQETLEISDGEEFDEDMAFQRFWDAYPSSCPRKVDRKKCVAKFYSIMQNAEDKFALMRSIMEGLERWKKCSTWAKDGGRFIRAPLVWLNGFCWEDTPLEVRNGEEDDGSVGRKPTNWRKSNADEEDSSLL